MTPTVPGLVDLAEVGRGGFGIVYRAHEERFEREVAVKVIREPGMSDEIVARFARECRALGSLSGHPNIVSVYDAGQTGDGDLFLTMEFLSGGSLAQRIARGGPADPHDVLGWGVALAGALETAHRGGIVHRDVKPENVLFSSLGQAKLVDFGIARMRTAFETRSGSISATLNHAAPEIIAGRPATAQADVYSLGSVLFFALTGHAPFDQPGDESLAPLIARIVNAEPPDLREQGVPEALTSVLEQALAKDPADRYATAAAFGEALQGAAVALALPVPAMPVSAIEPIPGMADAFGPDREVTPRLGTVHVQRRREAQVESPAPAPRHRRLSRRLLIAAAAAVVLAAAGVAVGLAATGPGTRPAAQETPLRLTDSVEHGEGLDVRRQYHISDDGSTIGSGVVLTNTASETSKFVWFEVIPRELASSLDDVHFSVKPDGSVDGQLIAYWVLTLAPGGEQPLSWTTAFPTHERPSMSYLKRVRLLMATEAANTKATTDTKRAQLAKATGASASAAVPVGPVAPSQAPPVVAEGGGSGGGLGGGVAGGVIPGGSGAGSGGVAPGGSGGGSGGGSVPVGGSGGGVSPPQGGGTGGGVPPATNHPPAISAANQSNSEMDNVSRTFSATDPDGDHVTITVSGLPKGLSASGGTVSGRIAADAVAVTGNWRSIASRSFPVTIRAQDARGATSSATISWTVRDTYTVMPNYIDDYGSAHGSVPDVNDLSRKIFACAYDPQGTDELIYRQSVAPGTLIPWGMSIEFWYGKNDTSCDHVQKGW